MISLLCGERQDAFGLPYFYDDQGDPTWVNGQPGSPWGNRILFTGRECLSDMRIYDFRNRVYHPELGRFLQPDPKHFEAGDYNIYRYCHNDPVNNHDPFGLQDQAIDKQRLVREFTRPVLGSNIPVRIRYTESGNWNDRVIANHYSGDLESRTGRAGETRGSATVNESGKNVDINLHVDWLVDSKYRDTDVVSRELQHVQEFRNLSKGIDGSLFTPGLSMKNLRGVPGRVAHSIAVQKFRYDRPGGSHDLKAHPAMPAILPEYDATR